MVMAANEMEQKSIASIKEETGATVKAWSTRLKKAKFTKRAEMMAWLKGENSMKHSYANVVVGVHLNGGKPVYGDRGVLLDDQFAGKEGMRPLYEAIEKAVLKWNPKVSIHPTKTYVSFRGNREFSVAAIKAREIRVGLDLGDAPYKRRLEKAKSLGAMPRIGHMMVICDRADICTELTAYLKESWARIEG
ncbi:MAG: DUF4287 domain-containing protein [Planctomycetes bacterium]|nr:DUF4287 domain-containing protein [Planctomycetota bacterium]